MSMRSIKRAGVLAALAGGLVFSAAASAQWVTPPWLPTPGGFTSNASQPAVRGVEIIDGIPYVVGDFTHAGGVEVNGITAWNGTQWLAFGPTPTTPGVSKAVGSGIVSTVIKYNGQLIMGGSFIVTDDGFTQLNHIAVLNGSNEWESLGFGVADGEFTNNGSVNTLAIYDGKLIVAGDFTHVSRLGPFPEGGYGNIAAWDGTSWSKLGDGLTGGSIETVYDLAVYNNELYALGGFTSASGTPVNNVAKWNGTSWSDVDGGLTGLTPESFAYGEALEVYNNELYAAGVFTTAGATATTSIARWNGAVWAGLEGGIAGSPLCCLGPAISDLTVFDGKLVATGEFDTAGVTAVQSIASWDGTTWANNIFSSGITNGFQGGTVLKGNGSTLYLSGDFETIGGLATPILATFQAAPACTADFNAVNGVTVQDIFDFLTAWLAGSPSADFNNVNGVTVQDIFDFLTAWLAGC